MDDKPRVETERILAEYERRGQQLPRDRYCISRPVNQFFSQQTQRACLRALSRAGMFPLRGRRVADIGCGGANWLLVFAQWGVWPEDLAGIDLIPGRIESARKKIPAADLHSGDAERLPWPDESFDVVTQFVVFTSILSAEMRQQVAREMLRILRPGGMILWYDFRFKNPQNPSVRAMRAGEVRSLFPGCAIDLRRVTLAPPIARRVVPISWMTALFLEKIPFLRTHYLAAIHKPR